jgi:hypothetical protein
MVNIIRTILFFNFKIQNNMKRTKMILAALLFSTAIIAQEKPKDSLVLQMRTLTAVL